MTAGVGDRLRREGMRHGGIYIAFDGRRHHIDMEGLTGGRAITIYGQNEVVKDLIETRIATSRRCSSRSRTSLRRASPTDGRQCRSARTASRMRFRAISSPAAMVSMASAGRSSRIISR